MSIVLAIIEIILNLLIQSAMVAAVFSLARRFHERRWLGKSFFRDTMMLSTVLVMLFIGHLFQILLWAIPFRLYGEFSNLGEAIYHSTVNYTTLGYGDIVMSHKWRMVGALEAACGVLMFGVSTATFFALMRHVFGLRQGSAAPGQAD